MKINKSVVRVDMRANEVSGHPGLIVVVGSNEIKKIIQRLVSMESGEINHFHLQHPDFSVNNHDYIGEITFVSTREI
jgi:hypothetical protein